MSKIETGGPAFPSGTDFYGGPNKEYGKRGLSLRDYFAAKAMQGLIAHHGDRMHIVDADGRTSLHFAAYDHADAMLKARNT